MPDGPTTEGYGGTFATQENFRIIRRALDEASERERPLLHQTNYSSGLCMSEIAWMAAVERLDMLLNDAMYGILFRDINMRRTFVDQYFSRRIIARAGIIINTGEDNYLTTADAVEKAHTVLASQFINEAFAKRAGLAEEQMGLGHAFEIDPWLEDSFLLEIAQAQLVRQIFDRHPIKWMPPTKHKTGDIFHSHVHDAMFNLVGRRRPTSRSSCSACSARPSTPRCFMDRYLSLKSARVHLQRRASTSATRSQWKPGGIVETRAREVLGEAHELLEEVQARHASGTRSAAAPSPTSSARATGGKGYAGVVERARDYVNPILDALETRRKALHAPRQRCRKLAPGVRRSRRRRHGADVVHAADSAVGPRARGRASASPRRTAHASRWSTTMEQCATGYTYFVVYGHSAARGRRREIDVAELAAQPLTREEIEAARQASSAARSSWSARAPAATRTPSASTRSSTTRATPARRGSRATRASTPTTSAPRSRTTSSLARARGARRRRHPGRAR